jgi:hypothetical protein
MSDGFFGDSGTGDVVDVAALLDSDIPGIVADIICMGCLVSFGTTRDGGALSIAVTNDGKRAKSYFRQSDEAVDWLRRGLDALRNGSGDPTGGQPKVVQRPARGRSKAV